MLNDYSSKNYIVRNSVTLSDLKSASNNGIAILRVKTQDKKWHFIALSKVSSGKVTIYDNKKSKKVVIKDMGSYLKKTYKFTSGIAI